MTEHGPLYYCGPDIYSWSKGTHVGIKRPEHESEYNEEVYNKWRFYTLPSI
jgi:hypothetical protein